MRVAAVAVLACLAAGAAQSPTEEVKHAAREGWAFARAAAAKGGAADSLVPVRHVLATLDKPVSGTSLRLQKEYARSLISAAIAAAQDERDEMELYLTHARDLSGRLEVMKQPAEWPLPIDEAEGELWLEVDRYAEAMRAYRRAASRPGAVTAVLGLARSAARAGDQTLACESYRRWLTLAQDEAAAREARDYVSRCAP